MSDVLKMASKEVGGLCLLLIFRPRANEVVGIFNTSEGLQIAYMIDSDVVDVMRDNDQEMVAHPDILQYVAPQYTTALYNAINDGKAYFDSMAKRLTALDRPVPF